jgi:hypothetical protein
MTVSRRRALQACAVVAAGGLAGCTGVLGPNCTHSASLELDEATDDAVAAAATVDTLADLGPLSGRIVETAVADGEATYRAFDQVIRDGPHETADGYHRLSSTVTAETPATRYDVEFDLSSSATPGDAVAFDDLPSVDRRALLVGLLDDVGRRLDSGRSEVDVSGEFPLVYDDAGRAASRVVPDGPVDRVSYEGTVLALSPTGETASATLHTYQVTAEPIADTTAEFAAHARENFLETGAELSSDDLSADQREIVDRAIEGEYGYGECVDDPSPAFEGLLVRLFGDVDPRHFTATDRLVRYDGTWYLADYTVGVA